MNDIEEFGLVRIDDRLIHGQVIAVWCKHQPFNRIVVVDDEVGADPFMQQVLSLAAPPGLEVTALPVSDGVRVLKEDPSRWKTTMVLMKTPQTAKRLYEEGLEFKALNVGGMGSKPGRKNIFKNTAASPDEIATLKDLMDKGVKITLMSVPGEPSKAFSELAGKV